MRSLILQVLDQRRDRIGLAVIGVTAALSSFAETMVLLAISVIGFRLAGESSDLTAPVGFGIEDASTSWLVFGGCMFVIARLGLLAANAYFSSSLITETSFRWRSRAVGAFQGASYECVEGDGEARLQTIVQTHVVKATVIVSQVAALITASTSLAIFVSAAVFVDVVAAAALLAFGGVVFLLLRPLSNVSRKLGQSQRADSTEFARLLAESTSSSGEQRVFGVESAVQGLITTALRSMTDAHRRLSFIQRTSPHLYTAIGYLALLVGLGAASRVGSDEISAVGAISLLLIRSLGHGQTLQSARQELAGAEAFVSDLVNAVHEYESTHKTFGLVSLDRMERLELVDAEIGYANKTVLSGVNVSIEHGESVGIIGPSGAGKSSLILTCLRLLDIRSGSYLVNGVESCEYSADSWSRIFSYVPQDAHLQEGTVADNISFYRRELSQEALRRAAGEAHLEGELADWPEGLDHAVGPRGGRLSGGQKQRVSVARALAGRPAVLVLDEPTSALDSDAEQAVTEVLRDLRGQMTLLIVAHRLTTLAYCDRILLVDDGTISELGSGSDLQHNQDLMNVARNVLRTEGQ